MLYQWYELGHAVVQPARMAADATRLMLANPLIPFNHTSMARHAAAAFEVFERSTRRYDKPPFAITATKIGEEIVPVRERVAWRSPFCRMVHFEKVLAAGTRRHEPKILLVAPMSGHFASLLRGTIETFLPDHDVYITDWEDARDISLYDGRFDLDDYIDHMRAMFTHFGGDVHVFAVCQPSVPVLAATAVMEAAGDANVPRSLILAGGPIDTRVSPTAVNRLAEERGTDWFARNVITTVPWPNAGLGRQVYPGFLQLTGFMTMNLDRHLVAHKDLFYHLVEGDGDSAEKHRTFYDVYLAVMDLTAEFYLQTIENVFVRHLMPRRLMEHRGLPVDLGKIRRPGLMTIEGENDDITGIGQCAAAQDLCRGIAGANKQHFECPDVGHYGIFNGSRFRREIAPRIARFIQRFEEGASASAPAAKPRDGSGLRAEPSDAAFTFRPTGR